ncbi:4-methyl-5(b-hydroxyethyl)-thiazole monophosphate biosynthesis [Sulfurivirga caldicuralii]|uniref:4-methyl-5(B-hydroxyethyl)-thiazole monophosphate biosynthesis n=1 Tax=Sulfurivirga caldicuralii TaxID=364032 RepID=A0A1N6DPF7_9GAMM|nr:DJ-1 family glyoxalase III [Sulfurivirga caldicuralii]SIN72630.1 4-methyl-5(b-hydroxyethyl)-thiazole monophosphate biosynthesis [Sulfurivirga caldicuralii]
MADSKRVLVPLAQGCEELEAVTIMDILVRGGIEVVSASLDNNREIHASRGTVLVAKTTLDAVKDEDFDLVALPGGLPGADYLMQDARILEILRRMHAQGKYVAAICAAPQVLREAGLLDGHKATSYPGVLDQHPAKDMQYVDAAVVEDDGIVTSKGPGTAMDFALALVEKLRGKAVRDDVEAALQRPPCH